MKVALAVIFIAVLAVGLYGAKVNGWLDIPVMSTPANPASGWARLYLDTATSRLGCLTSTGASCAPAAGDPALGSGTTVTLSATGNRFAKCTGTCTVTMFAPTVAGQQVCVWNGVGVSTAITLSAVTGVQYSKTDLSAYGTANTTATASAAAGNKICLVAPDTTHWDVLTSTGTWTMN